MTPLERLRHALATASTDWQPILAAQLLADALRRAHLRGQLDARIRAAVNLHLNRAADALADTVARRALEVGDTVVVQTADGQRQGTIAALFATTLFLDGDDTAHPRLAVVRNLTTRPDGPEEETLPCA